MHCYNFHSFGFLVVVCWISEKLSEIRLFSFLDSFLLNWWKENPTANYWISVVFTVFSNGGDCKEQLDLLRKLWFLGPVCPAVDFRARNYSKAVQAAPDIRLSQKKKKKESCDFSVYALWKLLYVILDYPITARCCVPVHTNFVKSENLEVSLIARRI